MVASFRFRPRAWRARTLLRVRGMSDAARNRDAGRPSGPPPMSGYDWLCWVLSRRARAYFQLRNEHYLYGGFGFNAAGTIRGEGDFKVTLRVTGNATVVDRESFVRHQTLLPEK